MIGVPFAKSLRCVPVKTYWSPKCVAELPFPKIITENCSSVRRLVMVLFYLSHLRLVLLKDASATGNLG